MPSMPVIAIVGRPNVGKSSLLNALAGRLISIVQDMPGVTRDRVSTPLQVRGRFVELVDTGGYGFVDPDQLTDHIRQQIDHAMARADLVLFLVDCSSGLTAVDREIAALLREAQKRVVIVANKADSPKADPSLGDFAALGLGTPIGVSARNGRNVDQVIDAIADHVDLAAAPEQIPDPELLVAIVGKRNAGKSTLVNAVAGLFEQDDQRVIVSETPGTTRDSIDVRFEKDGRTLVVIDTAGVRKKRHIVNSDIEFYGFHRAQRSIRRADVVLLLIDATEDVSEPDKKLAQYIAEQHKPVVLVVNKWDLAREAARQQQKGDDASLMERYREYLHLKLQHLTFAPIAFTTARDRRNVHAVIEQAQRLGKQARTRVGTGVLNRAVRQILTDRTPSTPSGRRARVYYVAQVDSQPPTIALVVNNPAFLDESYRRYILNRLRETLPFPDVPIRLHVRARGPGAVQKSIEEAPDAEPAAPAPQAPQARDKPRARPRPASSKPRSGPAKRGAAAPRRGTGRRRGG